jgi:hypothetical protein
MCEPILEANQPAIKWEQMNVNTDINLLDSAVAHSSARRAEAVEAPDYGNRPISPHVLRAWCLINYRDFAAPFCTP